MSFTKSFVEEYFKFIIRLYSHMDEPSFIFCSSFFHFQYTFFIFCFDYAPVLSVRIQMMFEILIIVCLRLKNSLNQCFFWLFIHLLKQSFSAFSWEIFFKETVKSFPIEFLIKEIFYQFLYFCWAYAFQAKVTISSHCI